LDEGGLMDEGRGMRAGRLERLKIKVIFIFESFWFKSKRNLWKEI